MLNAVSYEIFFFFSQLPCYVEAVDVTSGKLTLSLKQNSRTDEKISSKRKKISRVGKIYKLTVTNCTEIALEVESKSAASLQYCIFEFESLTY